MVGHAMIGSYSGGVKEKVALISKRRVIWRSLPIPYVVT